MHYFIDGYNFLFRLFQKKGSLQKQRDAALFSLNEEIEKLPLSITVVFDSSEKLREAASRSHLDALEIIYTTRQQSADDYIYKAIEEATHPQNETVVTSDRELAGKCRQLGANTLTVEQFLTHLQKRKAKKRRGKASKGFKESDQEMERLLKIFEEKLKNQT